MATLTKNEKAWIFKYLIREELDKTKKGETNIPKKGITRELTATEQAYLLLRCCDLESRVFIFDETKPLHILTPDYNKSMEAILSGEKTNVREMEFYMTLVDLREEDAINVNIHLN